MEIINCGGCIVSRFGCGDLVEYCPIRWGVVISVIPYYQELDA
ncbi:hypothetical protein MNB_SV-6-86 [hydrothermal vent metagenome]|uniref:Uncharacterized protein n=1 Tax=hydrothermal vent metagenome TaxID=652676 RepID=A0A1W1BK68_9ZZZZ